MEGRVYTRQNGTGLACFECCGRAWVTERKGVKQRCPRCGGDGVEPGPPAVAEDGGCRTELDDYAETESTGL